MRLRVEGLCKRFQSVLAVDGISFSVAPGEIFGLLGPNGAGKTTALRAIVGLLEPDAGSIEVDGIDRRRQPREAKRRIGFLPDRPHLPPRLTGREYLEYAAALYDVSVATARPRIERHLEQFALDDAADRLIESLSHGMKQKLALGALFVHDPPLLVVDEPMVGLDVVAQAQIRSQLQAEARRGKAVVLTTHTLPVAEAICDRLAIVNRGRIVTSGSLVELSDRAGRSGQTLEAIFLELCPP